MIKLKKLLTERGWSPDKTSMWMSGPPPGKAAGHSVFSAVARIESKMAKERARQIAVIDKKIDAQVKKELKGHESGGVKIVDARWRSEGIEVKLSGGKGSI